MCATLKEHIDLELLRLSDMTEEDVEEVLAIERASFSDPWNKDHFLHEIKKNDFSVPVVLKYKNVIIGYAVCWRLFEEFHLANIAIHPKYRGQGIGEFLLDKILKMVQDELYVVLEVRVRNLTAINLYQKKGFSVLFERKNYYPDGEDALIMVKQMKSGDKL
ncbi:MAG: ribosomal protein S18-alanine N-acetyltransferase [Calditrichia bacterium]